MAVSRYKVIVQIKMQREINLWKDILYLTDNSIFSYVYSNLSDLMTSLSRNESVDQLKISHEW